MALIIPEIVGRNFELRIDLTLEPKDFSNISSNLSYFEFCKALLARLAI